MRIILKLKNILCIGGFFLATVSSTAQNWEADIVRTANGSRNSSDIWRITNNTAKPISAAFPIGMFATSLFIHDKELRSQSLEMMGGLLVTAGTTETLKKIFNRKRPYQEYSGIYPNEYIDGNSFPSGHAAVAFFTATSLSIHHPKWYVIAPSFGWAAGVSYARLYYGQHNPSDLLGSAIVGGGSAWLSYKANRWLHKKRKPPVSKGSGL